MSPAAVVEAVAAELGLRPTVTGLAEPVGTWAQLNESDLAFLRRLVGRLDGDPQIVGEELQVAPRGEVRRGELTLELHGQLARARVVADLSQQISKITTAGWDPVGGSAVSGEASRLTHGGPGSGTAGADWLVRALEPRSEHLGHLAVATDAEARAVAEAAFDQRARRFVRLDGVAEGNAQLAGRQQRRGHRPLAALGQQLLRGRGLPPLRRAPAIAPSSSASAHIWEGRADGSRPQLHARRRMDAVGLSRQGGRYRRSRAPEPGSGAARGLRCGRGPGRAAVGPGGVPFAGADRGAFMMPDVDDEVLVVFLQGDPRYPLVIGGLWNGASAPPAELGDEGNRFKRIRSKNGVTVTLDDSQGQEQLVLETPGGQKLTLSDGPGKVTVEDSNGNRVVMEAARISITASAEVKIDAPQVKVSAGMVTVDTALAKFSGIVRVRGAAGHFGGVHQLYTGSGEHMVSHHEIILSAPRDLADGGAPAILQRSDEDFIEAVLASLRDPGGRVGLRASLAQPVSIASGTDTRRAASRSSGLELFNRLRSASRQLGLAGGRIEGAGGEERAGTRRGHPPAPPRARRCSSCSSPSSASSTSRGDGGARYPGEPRIDPQRVEGAGMVIRRLVRDAQGGVSKTGLDARRRKPQRGGRASALQPTVRAAATATTPRRCAASPARHRPAGARPRSHRVAGGTGRRLAQRVGGADVRGAARRLQGRRRDAVLRPGSRPPAARRPKAARAAVRRGRLRADQRRLQGPPGGPAAQPGRQLPAPGPRAHCRIWRASPATPAIRITNAMKRLLLLLRQLAVEFDAFGDSAEADALLQVLNGIALPLADAAGKPIEGNRPAGDFLAAAAHPAQRGIDLAGADHFRPAGRNSMPPLARRWRACAVGLPAASLCGGGRRGRALRRTRGPLCAAPSCASSRKATARPPRCGATTARPS